MKSNYALFIKEIGNTDIIEDNRGFLTYIIGPDYVYIKDAYVKPEFRKNGVVRSWVDQIVEIAKSKNIKVILTSASTDALGLTLSLKTILSLNFEYSHLDDTILYFKLIIGD